MVFGACGRGKYLNTMNRPHTAPSPELLRILRRIHERGLTVRQSPFTDDGEGGEETPRWGQDYETGTVVSKKDWTWMVQHLWRWETRYAVQLTALPRYTVTRTSIQQGLLTSETVLVDVPKGLDTEAISEGLIKRQFPELLMAWKTQTTTEQDTPMYTEIDIQNPAVARHTWTERVSDYLTCEVVDQDEVYEAWNGSIERYRLTDHARMLISP